MVFQLLGCVLLPLRPSPFLHGILPYLRVSCRPLRARGRVWSALERMGTTEIRMITPPKLRSTIESARFASVGNWVSSAPRVAEERSSKLAFHVPNMCMVC